MDSTSELRVALGLYALSLGTPIAFGPTSNSSASKKTKPESSKQTSSATSTTTTQQQRKVITSFRSPVQKFYLTTAINYTNGDPHFGHAYEAIMSDIIVRYHRLCGRKVFFLTGTDEHGQKVQRSAEEKKRTPKEHCDFYAERFKALDKLLCVEYDHFVRTTDEAHKKTAKEMWRLVKDDIYLSNYEGWYNRFDEMYVTPAEVEQLEKNATGVPLDKMGRELEKKNEESYFFKMSKYAQRLKEHIKANPNFIQPLSARAEIISFLEQNELDDLCVSRTSISWGVPVPNLNKPGEDDPRHVMYVWFDALTNYLTGVNGLDKSDPKSSFWPASVHVVGKDIVRFHTVYWPTMLMAAGVPIPETVFAHGFVTGADGQKMGKSLGNARDPIEQVNLYGVDALRYYMARAAAFGWDLAYNEEHLCEANNDILLKGFGNLVQRVYKVTCDNTSSDKPFVPEEQPIGKPFDLEALKSEFEACFSVAPSGAVEGDQERCGLRIRDATLFLERCVADANAFVDKCEPWKRKGDEHATYRRQCVRAFLEAVYCLTHFYSFFVPILANRVMKEVLRLDFRKNVLDDLSDSFTNLTPGHVIRPVDANNPLWLVDPLEPGSGKKARPLTGEEIVKQKMEEKEKRAAQVAANKAAKENAKQSATALPIDLAEIRVGQIVACEKVEGTKLIKEKVLVDASKPPLDVVSGIADSYPDPASQLLNRKVLIVLNLEPFSPKQIPGFVSQGMLLAAKSSDGSKLELVSPPPNAAVGDRIVASASVAKFATQVLAKPLPTLKSKQWEKAKGTLLVDGEGKVKSGDELLVVAATGANCFSETIRSGPVQ